MMLTQYFYVPPHDSGGVLWFHVRFNNSVCSGEKSDKT